MTEARYQAIKGSESGHGRFEASVIDTANNIAICECESIHFAEMIAEAINRYLGVALLLNEIERTELQEECAVEGKRADGFADILRRTALALRGPEPELGSWGWSDLPERAEAMRAALDEIDRLRLQVKELNAENEHMLAALEFAAMIMSPPERADD